MNAFDTTLFVKTFPRVLTACFASLKLRESEVALAFREC